MYAHRDDAETPLEETLGALDELVRDGKIRHIAASNYSPQRLAEALAISEREGLARFGRCSPTTTSSRATTRESSSRRRREDLACIPYYGLAKGFLTGKYRPGGERVDSPRGGGGPAPEDRAGPRVLEALDEVAAAHDTSVAAVALAWLAAQPTVLAPIASARTLEQLAEIIGFPNLELTEEELSPLSAASAAG